MVGVDRQLVSHMLVSLTDVSGRMYSAVSTGRLGGQFGTPVLMCRNGGHCFGDLPKTCVCCGNSPLLMNPLQLFVLMVAQPSAREA